MVSLITDLPSMSFWKKGPTMIILLYYVNISYNDLFDTTLPFPTTPTIYSLFDYYTPNIVYLYHFFQELTFLK